MGAGGHCPQNTHRDLMRILGRPAGTPEMYYANIPIKDRNGKRTFTMIPFLLPHEYFSQLHKERRAFFQEHIWGKDEERHECWDVLGQQDFVKANPVLRGLPGYRDQAVPIGLHGDAGAMSKNKSVFVLTWNSLAGQGSTKQTRYVMSLIRKDFLLDDGSTLDAIWEVLSWSLNSLASGKFPSENHVGAELDSQRASLKGLFLADGLRGVTLQMRGDWQWYCQCLGFPQWNCALSMCWICKAGNRERLWSDFRQSAQWRG